MARPDRWKFGSSGKGRYLLFWAPVQQFRIMTVAGEVAGGVIVRSDEWYANFFAAYAESVHGRHHAGQPLRYSAFDVESYGRESAIKDLTSDIHPLGHMPATEKIFLELLRWQDRRSLSSSEVDLGRKYFLTHDIGENTYPGLGEVVGDIPQGQKTDAHRAIEIANWDELIRLHFASGLTGDEIERLRELVLHQEESELARATQASHDLGTFRVGLRAGAIALDLLDRGQTDSVRFKVSSSLGPVVTRDIFPEMARHADHFRLSYRTLERSVNLYERIQTELAPPLVQ